MPTLRDRLFRTYFVFDARSLGLFRIAYASTLLTDLYLRFRALDDFYTNDGLLPNHTLLWAAPSPHMFSLFFTASTHGQAAFLMLLCAAAFAALLLGFHTKVAQVASLLAVTSLNTRISPLENGGDMVVNLLGVWTLVLPLGQRFSLDALRASLRDRQETDARELSGPDNRAALCPEPAPYPSLAVFALILQFAVIYLLNVVHKSGPTWLDGSAVHYTLHQDRLVKTLGLFAREHVPYPALRALSYMAMGVESLGVVAILSPFFTTRTRLLAVVLMPLLHLSFELFLDLGVFSFAMMSFFPLLLLPEHWRWLRDTGARLHRRRLAFFDASCGICFWMARVLARLDLLERVEIVPNTDRERLPAGVSAELVDSTIVVVDAESGRLYTRASAIAELLRALPFGFVLAVPLQLPGIAQLANLAYDVVAKNRARISVFFGMAACGLPRSAPASGNSASGGSSSEATRFAKLVRRALAEVAVAVVLIAAVGETLNNNFSVPAWLRYQQPALLSTVVELPRTFQGWRMFAPHAPHAPHAPTEDFMVEVDALTRDGRHVDPYNEVASRLHGPGLTAIPPLLHENQFFTAYSLFIWQPNFAVFRQAFQEWILRYPERTHHKQDRIVRFVAYKLSDQSPAPGHTQSTHFHRAEFMRFAER